MLDQHPHKIVLKCENPRDVAKHVIGIEQITGMSFQENSALILETNNLGDVHKQLPNLIVNSGFNVTGIDNPDDDLKSILTYLTGGYL